MYRVLGHIAMRIGILTVALFALALSLITPAKAQTPEQLDITTSPSSFDLTIQPGQTIKEKFRIRNNDDTPLPLRISLKKLIPDPAGKILLQDFKKEDDYQNWLTVENATFSAQPKEWTEIPFTITVPKTAAFGYYWALMVQVNTDNTTVLRPGAHITGAIALPILLGVHQEGVVFGGKLLQFKSDQSFSEYLPITFETTFQNMSNIHIKPKGDIFIKDWLGKTVATLPINKDYGNVLPTTRRTFSTVWNDSFITLDDKIEDDKVVTKNGEPEKELHFHFDRILNTRIGKYVATAVVVVSGDKKDLSFESTTSFWVFPWKIILGILAFVALAGFGLFTVIQGIVTIVRKIVKK